MRRFLVLLGALAMTGSMVSPAHAAGEEAARRFVEQITAKTLAVVQTDADAAAKQKELDAVFTPIVDIPFVGKFVLGQHWRTATPAQQKDYLAAYGPFLMKHYISRLVKYSGQSVEVTKAVAEKDSTLLVTMKIIESDSNSFFVEYRLRPAGNSFKLVDIVVEGVGLLTSQRSEFNSVVNQKGLDYLIEALKKKTTSAGTA
ncbi:MAG: phospholipid-binding protein MlaC [Alphaproteobacteria bacterium]|jgi:phospholipid transport system substrate-binding protein